MKIICVTKVCVERMHIFKSLPKAFLEKIEFVVHDWMQKERLCCTFNVPLSRIHVSGIKEKLGSLVNMRDWAENHLLKKDEWYIGLDDNIQFMTMIKPEYYHDEKVNLKSRDDWKFHCEPRIMELCEELKEKCIEMGTTYGGFEFMENPFFRQAKWKFMGYVRSKLFVKQSRDVKWAWNPAIRLMHDHAMSFMTMAKRGCIVHNRYVFVYRKQWEAGGLGTREDRMPARLSTCRKLYDTFPGFVVPNPKAEFDDPICRLRGLKSMERWRKEKGWT